MQSFVYIQKFLCQIHCIRSIYNYTVLFVDKKKFKNYLFLKEEMHKTQN